MNILIFLIGFTIIGSGNDSREFVHLTISQIDSICNNIDRNKNLVEGIKEGSSFSTYDLKDKKGEILYRIKKFNYLNGFDYRTKYYYYDKKLIKAEINIQDQGTKPFKTIYSASYYYDKGKPIKVVGENKKYSNSNEIFQNGMKYQSEFYKFGWK